MRSERYLYACIGIALAAGLPQLLSAQDGINESSRNRFLFTQQTFGGNGRTCVVCHSLETGTVSPEQAQQRALQNPLDPLFVFDGSDDGNGNGISRMTTNATILVTIPLLPNIRLMNNPAAMSVTMPRGIPTTLNTPSLDPVLMLDGRDPDISTQAFRAIQRHYQATITPSASDIAGITGFEQTEPFFSSLALLSYARSGQRPNQAPQLPEGTTDSEKAGRTFFVDAPFDPNGNGKPGACALCHSGPMLNQTNESFFAATNGMVPAGSRFQSVGVSEINKIGNPVFDFVITAADGTTTALCSPDPGRALITGNIPPILLPCGTVGPPSSDWNAFKIPTLWGVKNTAPYFHDNSAKTLDDVAAHYAQFFMMIPNKVFLTVQDQADIVAYLNLL
jgi:cytochrome c peroxidase